jgi:geranylgeranyl diphosphate synthase type II
MMSLDRYKACFEQELSLAIEKMGERSLLRDACSYALTNGGKRLRPILVLMIAEALGSCDAMPSALSVEFFHTASLIADDLPSMDNDSVRRGVPSLHVAFGESTALLTSYTLIAAGYGGIYENGKILRRNPLFATSADTRAMECLDVATRCAGIQGATQGQFLDLFPPNLSVETIRDIIYKKTVTLFEISFLFGWIFGGGDLQKIPLLKNCAYHLGLAFQINDDLEDGIQDAAIGGRVNMASALGKEKAISCFEEEIALLEKTMKALHLWTQPFQELVARLVACQRLCVRGFLGNGSSGS